MRMGNFRGVDALCTSEMKADRPPIGIDHPTVVPENFVPPAHRDTSDENEQGSRSRRKGDAADSETERLDWGLSGR